VSGPVSAESWHYRQVNDGVRGVDFLLNRVLDIVR